MFTTKLNKTYKEVMFMKKKLLAALLTTTMIIAGLTGCGGNDSAGSGSAGSGNSGNGGGVTNVALKVYCPQNQVDTGIMEQQQQAFAAAHPEYNITWTTEIVGEDKCAESILKDVGAAADVFLFASDQLPSLVEAGAIARLGGEAEPMVKETNAESVIATVTVGDAI